MGASRNQSSGGTYETDISRTQAAILKERESLFNSFYWPALQQGIQTTNNNSPESQAKMAQMSQQINTSFGDATKQTNQNLRQQGLLGTQSGVQSALTAQNNRAKASTLASAYYNQMQENNANKLNYMQLAGAMMPTTVNQVGYGQQQESSSWAVNLK